MRQVLIYLWMGNQQRCTKSFVVKFQNPWSYDGIAGGGGGEGLIVKVKDKGAKGGPFGPEAVAVLPESSPSLSPA